MAAFYIHIPYCKQACIYCNFHFSTSLKTKSDLLDALNKEIIQRKNYLDGETIETIYFGGGTPSLLNTNEIESILETINQHYRIDGQEIEITLEANPDDLTKEKLAELKKAGINRLSIGIQSFNDQDLKWLNRAHNAEQSINCIINAQISGFENITIDLIYGIPGQTDQAWMENLEKISNYQLPHFSAYALTVEPKTTLAHMIQKKQSNNTDEDQTASHFQLLQDWVLDKGYLAYEISNYCLPGKFSRHNSSYWQGKKYIGIGPSAHSFNSESRQWNIANNAKYINEVSEGVAFFEKEILTMDQKYNEYIMTSLRTLWGCNLAFVEENFGEVYLINLKNMARPYILDLSLLQKDNHLYLTVAGKLLADRIASDLFVVDSGQ